MLVALLVLFVAAPVDGANITGVDDGLAIAADVVSFTGKVGIGTDAPARKLHVQTPTYHDVLFERTRSANDAASGMMGVAYTKLSHVDPTTGEFGPAFGFAYQDGDTSETFLGFIGMYTDDGADDTSSMRVLMYDQGAQFAAMTLDAQGGGSAQCDLRVAGNVHGSAFQETSDERAKTDIQDLSVEDALSSLSKLRPRSFTMRAGGDHRVGFVAHELAEAGIAGAVSGEKGAIDEAGVPIMQSVDMSRVVPVLAKALQAKDEQVNQLSHSLQVALDRIEAMEKRLAAAGI